MKMGRYFPPEKSNSKIVNWSKKLWQEKKGIQLGIIFNIFIFFIYRTKQNICSCLVLLYLVYLLYSFLKKDCCHKQEQPQNVPQEEKLKEQNCCNLEGFAEDIKRLIDNIKESNKTQEECICTCILLLFINFLTKFFSDLFFIWIIGNLCIFYYPLNKAFPGCVFNFYLAVVQTIEGVVGLIECLIPRYEEPSEKKNA